MKYEKEDIIEKLWEIPRNTLEDVVKKNLHLRVRVDFGENSWKKVKDRDLIKKLADLCYKNNLIVNDLLESKVLYRNKRDFLILKLLGRISDYKRILISAINQYGLCKNPDYEELARISDHIYQYISSMRFDNAIEYPVYPSSGLLYDIKKIAQLLSTINQKNLKTKVAYKNFLDDINVAIQKAEDDYIFDIRTR